MGSLLLLLAAISLIATANCIIKRKSIKTPLAALLLLATILSCSGLVWFLIPIEPLIPENTAFKFLYDGSDYWVESRETTDKITDLLKTQKIQRELFHYNGMQMPPVKGNEFFYIEVYDLDKVEYSMPKHIGDYCFVIPSPASSRFIIFSNGARNKLKILYAEEIIDELYAYALSTS